MSMVSVEFILAIHVYWDDVWREWTFFFQMTNQFRRRTDSLGKSNKGQRLQMIKYFSHKHKL